MPSEELSGAVPQPAAVLPTSVPSYQRLEGQWAAGTVTAAGTSAGTASDSDTRTGSDVQPSLAACPEEPEPEDSEEAALELQAELLEEELRRIGFWQDAGQLCHAAGSSSPGPGHRGESGGERPGPAPGSPALTPDCVGTPRAESVLPSRLVSPSASASCPEEDVEKAEEQELELQDQLLQEELLRIGFWGPEGQVSAPSAEDSGASSTGSPQGDLESLLEEWLGPDCSVLEAIDSVLSWEQLSGVGLAAWEPGDDVGLELLPSPPALGKKRGQKRGRSPSAEPPSKRRAAGSSVELGGGM